MVRRRRGASQIGCLAVLMIMAAIGYFGLNVGQVFWDNYQYQDRMKQEARFAGHRSDAVIKRRVIAFADSLNLPEGAKNVHLRRGDHVMFIWAEYYVHIELPGIVREFYFNPQGTGSF